MASALLSLLAIPLFLAALYIVAVLALACGILFYAIFISGKKRRYKEDYKHLLVKGALLSLFTDVEFYPDEGLSSKVIEATDMMQMGNEYFSNDYISGQYKGVRFEQADVKIREVTSDGENTSTTTYFEGRWMIFEFNKRFMSDLQVREKGFRYAKKSGGWFSQKDKMRKIQMEDVQFNRLFQVFAANEHEAYYILTPHMMESIKRLSEQTKGELLLCFVDNRLHVAVNSGEDAFEVPLFSKISRSLVDREIYGAIEVITQFVDEMNLENTIFKADL